MAQVVLKARTNARSENATIVMVEAHSTRRIALAASARIGPNVIPNDWCNRYSATANAASVSSALDVHAVAALAKPTPSVARTLTVTTRRRCSRSPTMHTQRLSRSNQATRAPATT